MRQLLAVTGLVESPTGLLLLAWPALVVALLFGWQQPHSDTLLIGRLAGAGVLSIAVASWTASRGAPSPALLAVLVCVLTYHVLCAVVLVLAAAGLHTGGVLFWPAVVYHVTLGAWSLACMRTGRLAPR